MSLSFNGDVGLTLLIPLFLLFAAFADYPGLFDELTKKLDYALPFIFYYDHHAPAVQTAITKKIKEFYFDNKLTRDKELNVTNVMIANWYLILPNS